ncbi:hypothetical protein GCG54_00008219 [Colletotrichum gloeosporioides]|uniref:Uncharacterized protein n=1 Tax=Colletotrichum gloeosporioides TaxID=474922 RepID=A0A8H4C7X9_COLGL|nr:uncharacterized protein GCG54_00008219 [Colletotrichum gloeosporioides]KAF3798764.1 hypothetical protein GCG54_00008219 [Colletotrichum gloeosporioides]
MKVISILQVLFLVALAICVKAARAQSEGGAPTDSELDSSIDQRLGESDNQKRWRFKYPVAVRKNERDVPGARFYYPSIKKRQSLNSDMDTEAEDSWKIFQRSQGRQMDHCKWHVNL